MSRYLVFGGAGFVGSHLCEALINRGDEVVAIDDLSTGVVSNLSDIFDSPRFTFMEGDVCQKHTIAGGFDGVLHLASPASPPDYLRMPIATLRAGSLGTDEALQFAAAHEARFVLASTSEVYGEPLVHPQREDYWGNVNPIGPRSVYDEAKRYAEAVTMAYKRAFSSDVGIARIFNTYGPRMRRDDGRVVSNFITQALTGDPLTIYGDGSQTRSFCYVTDTVDGLLRLLDRPVTGPVNLGNPEEVTVSRLARLVIDLANSRSDVVARPLPDDDPTRRCPDISRAQELLGWSPSISLDEGLPRALEWFKQLEGEATL